MTDASPLGSLAGPLFDEGNDGALPESPPAPVS